LVRELEQSISDLLGVRHCIAVCNGTVGLEAAIRALGLTGEVIVPSFTFIATAHALQWQGITPVFCDVDVNTHNLDPAKVERLITRRTSGILGVHLWGRPCAIETLADIARRRHLHLFFDAAHAFACSHRERMIGNFGDLEVFSFHATKFFHTFEGGAVVTNDDTLAARVRSIINFGFADSDCVESLGTNGKMSEVSAAMGLTGLESLDEFIAVNLRNYEMYREGLAGLGGMSLIRYDQKERCNYQYIVVEIDERATGISRDELLKALHGENVMARRYFCPGCHEAAPYRTAFPAAGTRLPVTRMLTKSVLVLPTGTAAGGADIQGVAEIIRFIIKHSEELAHRGRRPATVASVCD
jgi:dTDP-4-amino-4,6-dideoxygalactose transaminase